MNRPSSRRNPPDPRVIAIGVVGAIGAALSGAEPTGTAGWDHVLCAVLVLGFVLAAPAAPVPLLIGVATLAAVLVEDSVWIVAAGAGLLAAIALAFIARNRPEHRWLSALAAAGAAQGLLRLDSFGFFGAPSLVAGAAFAVVLGAGHVALERSVRRRVGLAVGAIIVLTAAAGAVGGVTLLRARSNVEAGIDASRSGVSAARDGDPVAVVAELEQAADLLDRAEQRTDSIWVQPLRLIPVAAQHVDMISAAVGHGSAIATQASRTVVEADISEVTMTAGRVDLAALAAMEPDLVATADLLERAGSDLADRRSGWLVPQLSTRVDELTDELLELAPEARVAADAALVVPGMLGNDGPRRYFVGFGSPSEARELGGFIGSWALLEFDDGSVDLIDSGRVRDLYPLTQPRPELDPERYPVWFAHRARPHLWPQNLTSSPDLGTVTAAAAELLDGLGDGPIDGFVYVDPVALGAFLQITGPVVVDGLDDALTSAAAADFFTDGQYRLTERDELKSELGDVFAGVFERLLDVALPGPERLGAVLGPAARQGHLQIATLDEAENDFLQSIRVQRTFGLSNAATDAFAVVHANGSASKLDTYLQRRVHYDVDVADDGSVEGTATVTLTSDVPADAPPYVLGTNMPGVNRVYLSLYTPHLVDQVRVDGVVANHLFTTEHGYLRAEVTVDVVANGTRVVEFDFGGSVDPGENYAVSVWHQPLLNDDLVEITATIGGREQIATSFVLGETTTVASPS